MSDKKRTLWVCICYIIWIISLILADVVPAYSVAATIIAIISIVAFAGGFFFLFIRPSN